MREKAAIVSERRKMPITPNTRQNQWLNMIEKRRQLAVKRQRGGAIPMSQIKKIALNQVKDLARLTLPGVHTFARNNVDKLTDFGLKKVQNKVRQQKGLKSLIARGVGSYAKTFIKKGSRDIQNQLDSAFGKLRKQAGGRRKTNSDRSLYMDPMSTDKMKRYFESIRKKERAYNNRNNTNQKGGIIPLLPVLGGLAGSLFKQMGLGKRPKPKKQKGGILPLLALGIGGGALFKQLGLGRRKPKKQRGGAFPMGALAGPLISAAITPILQPLLKKMIGGGQRGGSIGAIAGPALKMGGKILLSAAAGPLIKAALKKMTGRGQSGGMIMPNASYRSPPFFGSWKQFGRGLKVSAPAKKPAVIIPFPVSGSPTSAIQPVAVIPAAPPAKSRWGAIGNFLNRPVVNKIIDSGISKVGERFLEKI